MRQMQITMGYPNKLTTPAPPPSGAERGGTTAQHTGSLSKAVPPDHSQHPQEDALHLRGHKAGQRKDVVGGGPDGLLRVLQIQRSDSPTGGGVQPCSSPVVLGPCRQSGVNTVAEDED